MHGRVAHQDRAGARPVDAGDHVDQGRFAAARLADHRNELAAVDLQVDPAQRGEIPSRGLISLYDRAQLDQVVVAVAILAGLGHDGGGGGLI